MLRATVAQVVAVDAGDHHVAQPQRGDGLAEVARFFGIGRLRAAVADVAERTAPGAEVAQDHECRRALAEALADVRAGGLLAHRMELLLAQDLLDLVEARIRVRGLHTDPVGLLQRDTDRHDRDRIARGLGLRLLLLACGGRGNRDCSHSGTIGNRACRLAMNRAARRSAISPVESSIPSARACVTARPG